MLQVLINAFFKLELIILEEIKYEYVYDTFSILTRQPFEECSLYKVLGEPKKVLKQGIKEDYDKEGKYGHILPDGTKYSIWNDYDGWNNSLIAYKSVSTDLLTPFVTF